MKQVTAKIELTERTTGNKIYKLAYNNNSDSKAVVVGRAEFEAAKIVYVPRVRYVNTSTIKGLRQAERLQSHGWTPESINPITNVIKLVH